jgi:hypothetical protein
MFVLLALFLNQIRLMPLLRVAAMKKYSAVSLSSPIAPRLFMAFLILIMILLKRLAKKVFVPKRAHWDLDKNSFEFKDYLWKYILLEG